MNFAFHNLVVDIQSSSIVRSEDGSVFDLLERLQIAVSIEESPVDHFFFSVADD